MCGKQGQLGRPLHLRAPAANEDAPLAAGNAGFILYNLAEQSIHGSDGC